MTVCVAGGTTVGHCIGISPPMVAALPIASFGPAFGASCDIVFTRARQGKAIFVPPRGQDGKTRSPGFYEWVSQCLVELGVLTIRREAIRDTFLRDP